MINVYNIRSQNSYSIPINFIIDILYNKYLCMDASKENNSFEIVECRQRDNINLIKIYQFEILKWNL